MLFGKYASRKSEAAFPSLWAGLDHVWAPCITSPSGNSMWDLVGRNNHGTSSGLVGTDWDRALGFNSLNYDGTDNYTSIAKRVFASRAVVSVLLWSKMSATTHNMEITEGDSNVFRCGFGLAGDGNAYLVNSPGGIVQNFCYTNWSSLGVGALISYLGVFDTSQSTDTNRAAIYLQGLSRSLTYSGSGPLSTTPIGDFSGPTQIGRRPTNDNYSTGKLLQCAVWSRALKPAEAMLLYRIGPTGLMRAKAGPYFGTSGITFRRSLSSRIGSRSLQ